MLHQKPIPIYEQCVGSQGEEVQTVKGIGRVWSGLDQAEEQRQLQGVVPARGNQVAPEGVGQQAREPPGRAGRGLQQSLEVLTDPVGICGGNEMRNLLRKPVLDCSNCSRLCC